MWRSGRVGSKPALTFKGTPLAREASRRSSSSGRVMTSTTPRRRTSSCSWTGRKLTASVVGVVAARDREVAAVVDELLELLADLEEREALGGHGYGGSRPRVASRVRLVRAHREAAEASNLDALAAL